ncbi:hypothetical protein CK228_29595 [Mesorhizobium sp. WSM4312]|uniref:hypothetical protein n=1 Tax=unclassified Mesorhizobium TaxID=325217 RepID=UPI000BB0CB2B|nr:MULTISPECIES: hypothetical protein [unclassified Mesorhizobium]PBB65043.1 hypothetical protein CK228_29595 [Mesorhizobium sp. WSM4312]PBC21041.1 hypothetical protein CK226_19450 [Mesorhizobium sp. WSM4311]TRC92686.1 hypothetical protein FJV82_31945 [Mesorhizobium sp. WSM4305]
MERILGWLSKPRTAQTALGVLLVIAMRSILEFFRIGGASGTQLSANQLFYIEGTLAAIIAAFAVLVLHAFGRHGWATLFSGAAIVALLAWKIAVIR